MTVRVLLNSKRGACTQDTIKRHGMLITFPVTSILLFLLLISFSVGVGWSLDAFSSQMLLSLILILRFSNGNDVQSSRYICGSS